MTKPSLEAFEDSRCRPSGAQPASHLAAVATAATARPSRNATLSHALQLICVSRRLEGRKGPASMRRLNRRHRGDYQLAVDGGGVSFLGRAFAKTAFSTTTRVSPPRIKKLRYKNPFKLRQYLHRWRRRYSAAPSAFPLRRLIRRETDVSSLNDHCIAYERNRCLCLNNIEPIDRKSVV